MKAIVYLVWGALFTSPAFAQKQDSALRIYQSLAGDNNVTSLSLSKPMLSSLHSDFMMGEVSNHISGDFYQAKVLIMQESDKTEKQLKHIYKELKNSGCRLEKIPEGENSENLTLFTRRNGKNVSEVHILMKEDRNSGVLISIYGDILITENK